MIEGEKEKRWFRFSGCLRSARFSLHFITSTLSDTFTKLYSASHKLWQKHLGLVKARQIQLEQLLHQFLNLEVNVSQDVTL